MIEIESVTKSFKEHVAVDNLSLKIKAGEIVGLLGANGAGKSTTINMLLGFLQPDIGSVKINSKNTMQDGQKVRELIGYIPENLNLYPYLSGIENLDYFCKLANLNYEDDKLKALLVNCGLSADAHDKKVSQYSKGMRQKVGIAIAYAKNAKIYLLDEPASGLDPLASNELSEILKKLAAQGAAILMASHDLFRVREVCHRIGILKRGKLVKELQTATVSANELESIYLQFMKN